MYRISRDPSPDKSDKRVRQKTIDQMSTFGQSSHVVEEKKPKKTFFSILGIILLKGITLLGIFY